MKTIEIHCLECINCTGDSCKVYGPDADKAVKACAYDSFENYKPRKLSERIKITDNLVKAAAITIADYCSQRTGKDACKGCAIYNLCEILRDNEIPENWPDYMEEK